VAELGTPGAMDCGFVGSKQLNGGVKKPEVYPLVNIQKAIENGHL